MGRVFRVLPLLAAVALAGCGSAKPPTGSGNWSPPDPGVTAPPSAPKRVTLQQAIARYVGGNYPDSSHYVGRCETAKPDPDAVCALKSATVDAGEVWGIGAPHSETDGFLLLTEGDTGWKVADTYVPAFEGEASPAPTPSWFVGVG